MAIVVTVFLAFAVLVFAFWAEFKLELMERRFKAREDHPAGKSCPDCGLRPDDMETHRRLAHAPRAHAPEDNW